VFDPRHGEHAEFVPLLKWLYDHPRTSMVMGGRTYQVEMSHLPKYWDVLVELKRRRKLSMIDDDVVDAEEGRLKAAVSNTDFDDAHIVALVCASGCVIVASHDKRADPYLKDKSLYPKNQSPPSIYRLARHEDLLQDERIVSLRNTVTRDPVAAMRAIRADRLRKK